MESFSANSSYYEWPYDFRHVQTEAVNYMSKLPTKQKGGNLPIKKVNRHKDNPKTCPVCGVLINNPWNLTVHIRRHNNEKPYKCEKCAASFVIRYELKVHLRSHSEQLLHKCSLCQRMFKTACGKRLHEDTHGKNEYSCRICDEKFTKFTERRKHESGHKNSELKCSFCFKEFATLEYKKQHEIAVHNKPKVKQKPRQKSSKPRAISSHTNRNNNFRCKICSMRFVLKKDYFSHVQKLHPEQTDNIFKECKICGKIFTGYFYVYHMKAHQGDMPHSCSLCEYKTARQKDLRTHMRTHSSARPFDCKECGKTFKLSKSLKLHQDTHTGKKDIRCSICEKTFFSQRALEEHKLKVHFKKLEKCHICGKEVSSKYIKTHIRNEHERSDDPVICEHCGKRYQNESKLKQHLFTIKNSEIKNQRAKLSRLCPYCNEEVSGRQFLVSHCKLMHPSKVYKCIVCPFINLNVNKYKQHMQRHFTDSSFELAFYKIFAKEKPMEEFVSECHTCGSTSKFKNCVAQHEDLFGELDALPLSVRNRKYDSTSREVCKVFVNVRCKGEQSFKVDVTFKNIDQYDAFTLSKLYNLEVNCMDTSQPIDILNTTLNGTVSKILDKDQSALSGIDHFSSLVSSTQVSSDEVVSFIGSKNNFALESGANHKETEPESLCQNMSYMSSRSTTLPYLDIKEESEEKPDLTSDISYLKEKLHTFNGKKFLSVEDLCNLKKLDLQTIIQYLK